ncbi:MAG: GIY-YIG nuclease family protein [Coleofasciculaceae cyanobacterium]
MARECGYVYLVESVGDPNRNYKIGISNNPKERFDTLKNQSPYPQRVVDCIQCSDKTATENVFHSVYAPRRKHGEWFKLSKSELKQVKHLMEVFAKHPEWDEKDQYEYALKTNSKKFKLNRSYIIFFLVLALIILSIVTLNYQKQYSQKLETQLNNYDNKKEEYWVRLGCGVTFDPKPPTNIRSRPNQEQDISIVGKVPNGTFVEFYEEAVDDAQKKWFRVIYKKDTSWGWIAKRLIKVTSCP